jgi:hypothetical protein
MVLSFSVVFFPLRSSVQVMRYYHFACAGYCSMTPREAIVNAVKLDDVCCLDVLAKFQQTGEGLLGSAYFEEQCTSVDSSCNRANWVRRKVSYCDHVQED